MPRKRAAPSGAGLAGMPSGNRTDLAAKAPTGLPYGEAGALQAAQQAVPMGAQPSPAAPGGPPGMPPGVSGPPGVPGGSNAPPGGLADILAAAQAMPPPSGPGLSAPTMRPNEPVTAGLPSGPGPGPEVLNMAPAPPDALTQTLQAAAQATGSGLLANLAAQVSGSQ